MNDENEMEVVVHWVIDTPVADIKAAISNAALPGEWLPYKKVRSIMDAAADSLESLHGDSMTGELVACIRRDLSSMALVEYQRRKASSPGKTAGEQPAVPDSHPESLDETREEADIRRAKAVEIAESLLKMNTEGEIVSAEHYLSALSSSPDLRLTENVLALRGGRMTFHGRKRSFTPTRFKRLPGRLESAAVFRVRLSDYGELQQSSVQVRLAEIHLLDDQADNEVARILVEGDSLPIFVGGSLDGTLFRFCAAAGITLEAEVTATVSTERKYVIGLSLVGLVDPGEAGRQLKSVVAELQDKTN
jgi:hypothetical protein